MILNNKITIKKLSEEGKNFKWDRCRCEKCNRNMWGHGFVRRYFSVIPDFIYLKRHRCPSCGIVITTRPEGYAPSLRTSNISIYQKLHFRIACGFWPSGFPRQRGGHWLRRFVLKAKMSLDKNLLSFLEICFSENISFFT